MGFIDSPFPFVQNSEPFGVSLSEIIANVNAALIVKSVISKAKLTQTFLLYQY